MFNWLGAIFTLISAAILFITWSRTIAFRDHIKSDKSDTEWKTYRLLILVSLIMYAVLFVLAIFGMEKTYGWLAAIFLMFFQATFLLAITFVQGLLTIVPVKEEKGEEEESE